MKDEFYTELDFIKGILIITVILGHLIPDIGKYANWFHMPIFFMISGFLMNSSALYVRNDGSSYKNIFIEYAKKRARRLLIPYVFYWMIMESIMFFRGAADLKADAWSLIVMGAGGKSMTGIYGTWWFTSCLLISQLIYIIIIRISNHSLAFSTVLVIIAYISIFLLSVFSYKYGKNSILLYNNPWNIFTSLWGILYIHIGVMLYLFREKINIARIKSKSILVLTVCILSIIATYVAVDYMGCIDTVIEMKTCRLGNDVFLPIIIPITVGSSIYCLAYLFKESVFARFIRMIGTASLPIMYIHNFVLYTIRAYVSNDIVAICMTLVISIMAGMFIKHFSKRHCAFRLILG